MIFLYKEDGAMESWGIKQQSLVLIFGSLSMRDMVLEMQCSCSIGLRRG
jgi:hypothetical protein